MITALTLLAGHIIALLAHTIALACAGRAIGARIEEAGIFTGPVLIRLTIGDTVFRLNLIPLGGYVKFAEGESAERRAGRGVSFRRLHPLRRALVAASGCVALIVLAALCLGPADALRKTISGFPQIIGGTLSPLSTGAGLLSLLPQYVATHSFAACVGLVASKEAAFNLLPLPILNGGDIVTNLLSWARPIPQRVIERLNLLSLLLLIAVFGCWAVAIFSFLAR